MSGFKISSDSLRPEFYQIVLTLSGGTGTYPTVDGTNNGAIYTQDHSQFATVPSTYVIGKRVARGHIRFLQIVEALSKFSDCQIQDLQFTSAGVTSADNQPTSVTFTVRFDRGGSAGAGANDAVLGGVRSIIGSPYQFTPTTGGAVTVDTTAKAIRYLVANAITATNFKLTRVFNGASLEESMEYVTVAAPDTIADVYDDVAVTLVDAAETIDS